jgi:acyl-CoA thioesterase
MGDFTEQTALEDLGDGRYRAELHRDWMTWGPAGGYVAAVALRAGGASSEFTRPASFSCQFLSVAKFDAVELVVESVRRGRRSEALRVSMTQGDRSILEAQVWAVDEQTDGLEHDYTKPPDVPGVDTLKDIRELEPDRPQRGFFQNLERRPITWWNDEPLPPVMQNWNRFMPTAIAQDRFVDACRSVILIDVFSWPATWPAHPSDGPSPWIAPNLDLHVRFHHDARTHDWLLCETRAELAADGLIGTKGSTWSTEGHLIAEGSSQLFCRPRPERFR